MGVTSEYISTKQILIFRFSGTWTWEDYDTQLRQIQPIFAQAEAACLDVIIDFTPGSPLPPKTKTHTISPQWLQIESVQHLLIAGIQQVNLSPLETARRLSLFPQAYHMTRTLDEAFTRLAELRGSDSTALV